MLRICDHGGRSALFGDDKSVNTGRDWRFSALKVGNAIGVRSLDVESVLRSKIGVGIRVQSSRIARRGYQQIVALTSAAGQEGYRLCNLHNRVGAWLAVEEDSVRTRTCGITDPVCGCKERKT